MPEGHTIHRMAKDHSKWFQGRVVSLRSPQGRFSAGAQQLDGAVFRGAYAHGKHLFYRLDPHDQASLNIHIHLGLFGKFRKRASEEVEPSPNCRLRMCSDTHVLDLSGPTCCEVLTPEEAAAKCGTLGPDPLRSDGSASQFAARLKRRRIPIAAALLDQKVIAGLGNIYRAELLFHHRINPMTPAADLTENTARELWDTAAWWLDLGVRANRIITVLDASPKRVPRLPRREAVFIYGKQNCPVCGDGIVRREVGNRTLFVCDTCQTRKS